MILLLLAERPRPSTELADAVDGPENLAAGTNAVYRTQRELERGGLVESHRQARRRWALGRHLFRLTTPGEAALDDLARRVTGVRRDLAGFEARYQAVLDARTHWPPP